MKTTILICLILIAVISSAIAESLWKPASGSLFVDPKAHQVGDVVTILIVESTSSTQKATTDFSKSLNHANSAGVGPIMKALPPISAQSAQKGTSTGSTSRSSDFQAKITATVTKVLPNGNLVVEGSRVVQTNKEKQNIKITGTIRQQDIAPDNTVLSTYLADADIQSDGKGIVGDRQKEGLISKLVKLIF